MRRLLLLLSLLLLTVCAACAQDAAELAVDHRVASTLVTPHTDWGTPYALGRTRVLFFVRGHGTEPREVVELTQRFDLDAQMVFWARIVDSTKEGWHGGENGVQRMARLLEQKWDAYVFLGVPLERLPTEQQYKLLQAVTGGAGLVLRGLDDKRVLKDKNRLAELPALLADVPAAAAFSLKQGRGLRLGAQPAIAYRPGWEVDYDEWAARLGKSILWAAKREPQTVLTVQARTPQVPRALLPQAVATVTWQAPAAAKGLALDCVLRRSDGLSLALAKPRVGGLAGQADLTAPVLSAGDYHLDVIARSSRGVESFASCDLAVVSPRRITALRLARDWAEPGEKLAGEVACEGEVSGADEHLRVSLYDRRGRELLRQEVGAVAAEGDFSFDTPRWLPMLVTVRAALLRGSEELCSAWQFARLVHRNRGQFNFLIWDVPGGTLAPYAEESLARSGMTLQLNGAPPPPYAAAYDVAWVPYTTRILAQRDAEGTMKPACWNDEAGIQAQVDAIVQKSLAARQHGVFVYSLGDEGDVRGACLSPQCLAAYQGYLQREYGTIAALNASWGTSFDSFAAVTLSAADDNDEKAAFQAGNFPRWYDRQAFASDNFCRLCERFGKGFRAIDPQSRCGFEGAGTFEAADDLDGFVRANTFWSPYPGLADEVVRSIAPRDFPRSNWMGYTKDADTLLQKYWRMVTRGCDAVWWWRWDCIGAFHGWLSPTLEPYPAVKEILRDTQVVRDGLGDLLLRSEQQDDGIGILFSQPSAYATKAASGPSFGSYAGDHAAWHSALRELGLNFRYVTDRQLRLGEVKLSDFKAVVLPRAEALGTKEAQALRDYVQGGGTLIADARPGLYDGHVKPLATGAVDDLFGVRRTAAADAATADGALKGDLAGAVLQAALPSLRCDSGVEAAGAVAHGLAGKCPLLLVNKAGRGQAVLLNFPLSSYPNLAAGTTPEPAAEALRALLTLAGVQPALVLRSADGQRLRNVEITRWQSGETQLVSIFRQGGVAETARLVVPKGRHVYDLKQRKDLGTPGSLSLALTPCRAQFLALSTTAAGAGQVIAPRGPVARGTTSEVLVSAPTADREQALKLQVKLPNGQPADWLTRIVVTDRKGRDIPLPIAFNDPAGTWTISTTELFSNRTASTQLTVK